MRLPSPKALVRNNTYLALHVNALNILVPCLNARLRTAIQKMVGTSSFINSSLAVQYMQHILISQLEETLLLMKGHTL